VRRQPRAGNARLADEAAARAGCLALRRREAGSTFDPVGPPQREVRMPPDAASSTPPSPKHWMMFQEWRQLLFMSWPIDPDEMRRHVPADIEVDLHEGKAWLSMLPMHMEDLHFRYLPPLPGTSDFPEINLRTYVRVKGQVPGVFFFSLDSSSWLGAFVARHFIHTPYVYAKMKLTKDGDTFHMTSDRKASRYAPAAQLDIRYRPVGEPQEAAPGSLAHFLVERYTAIAETKPGVIYSGPVSHSPWKLSDAEAEVELNTIPQAAGFDVDGIAPSLHFSRGTDTKLSMVKRIPGK
jgi:hypothetical protein